VQPTPGTVTVTGPLLRSGITSVQSELNGG
jgi:hypothetical protein